MKIKVILLTVLLFVMCFTLIACSGETEKAKIDLNVTDGKLNYTVVYSESADELVIDKAEELASALSAITGCEVTAIDDSSKATECEILVGRTFRAESANAFEALEENGYTVDHSGSKVVLIGHDDVCTIAAVQQMLDALETDGEHKESDSPKFPEEAFGEATYSPENAIDGNYYISKMDGFYKTQGRTIMYEKGLAMLASADIFEFNADCEGKVSVKIFGETTVKNGKLDVYYTGYVDGERCETRYEIGVDGMHELVLAEDLEKGEHSFRIVRQTEWNHGDVYVIGVTVNGKLIDPPTQKDLYIEFIGDSLTTGFGNMPHVVDDEEWGGAPAYHDATQAYPYMVAEKLDADLSVVAIQGIGSACGGHPFTMNEVYNTYPRINEGDYTYEEERSADIVVINMLANDAGYRREARLNIAKIVAKAKELCEMVREQHPDSIIVFAPAAFGDEVKEMIETELGGAENGYYVTDIPQDRDGKSGHPSVAGHERGTAALVPFLEKLIEENGLRG